MVTVDSTYLSSFYICISHSDSEIPREVITMRGRGWGSQALNWNELLEESPRLVSDSELPGPQFFLSTLVRDSKT